MLVSIVVITYNQEQTIAQTLDSILAQKVDFEYEIILGEDASLDGTRAICESYAKKYPRIRLMPKAPNKGLLQNYADCVAACSGKYLATCAGDDYWNGTEYLAQKVSFLEANPDYGVVHTDHDILHVGKNCRLEVAHRKQRRSLLHSDHNVFVELMGNNPSGIAALTMLVRLDLLKRYVDLYSYISMGFMMEDLPTWLELSQHTLFKYLDISSATYRIAEGSACNNAANFVKNERFSKNVLMVKLWFLKRYPKYGIDPQVVKNQFYAEMSYAAFKTRNEDSLRKYLKLWQPVSLKTKLARVLMCTPLLNNCYHLYITK